ncbi:MAG: DNA polymerase I, partial [Alphaproteobacteria bacterium]
MSKKGNKAEGIGKGDHLYLVDGSGYIFRAFHALPPLNRKSDGLPTGAVYGFCNMLYKLLEETKQGERPTHFAVIFDHSAVSFRNEIYEDYKANRAEPPEDLRPQFGLIRHACRAFHVPALEKEGYEADDLIATYAEQAREAGARVTIVSSDKDLMQLVGDGIAMFDSMKNRAIGEEEVREKFGVSPEKVVDIQALAGDSIDNIPGVPGIGVKTAAQLIDEYGDLETLLQRAEEIKQPKRRENLIGHAEMARVSKQLVTLDRDVPLEVPLADLRVVEPEAKTLIGFLKAMEFSGLTNRVATALEAEADEIEPTAEFATGGKLSPVMEREEAPAAAPGEGPRPGAIRHEAAVRKSFDLSVYETVTTAEHLREWVARATEAGVVAVDTETDSLDACSATLCGVSLAVAPEEACYIPLNHGCADEFAFEEAPQQIPTAEALKILKPMLEAPSVLKVGQNLKYDCVVLARHGIRIHPLDDTLLISYALDAGLHGHGMDELSMLHLKHRPIPFSEVAGKGRNLKTFDKIAITEAARYAAEDADVTLRLHALLKPRLAAERMTTVYETLERPLVSVLAAMEGAGVKVDRQALSRLSGEFAQRMGALEAEAHELAGESFNIGSPRQLGEILFDKMSIPSPKKTRTGAHATGADILEQLAAEGHELPRVVLQWRMFSKLRSTYTEALPGFINRETGRIHTSYSLAATSTGRLSSSDPNLQNIPIRTEEGRKIRDAFVAEPGNRLISADYSQIELRVLAHMAGIDSLKAAFEKGEDIHARTASEMFGVPIEKMDPVTRRKAKTINFGIIYGISPFGLAANLG